MNLLCTRLKAFEKVGGGKGDGMGLGGLVIDLWGGRGQDGEWDGEKEERG